MDKVHLSGHVFSDRTAPLPDLRDERIFTGGIKVKALFEVDCKWRLVEEFDHIVFKNKKMERFYFRQTIQIKTICLPGYYLLGIRWNCWNRKK